MLFKIQNHSSPARIFLQALALLALLSVQALSCSSGSGGLSSLGSPAVPAAPGAIAEAGSAAAGPQTPSMPTDLDPGGPCGMCATPCKPDTGNETECKECLELCKRLSQATDPDPKTQELGEKLSEEAAPKEPLPLNPIHTEIARPASPEVDRGGPMPIPVTDFKLPVLPPQTIDINN